MVDFVPDDAEVGFWLEGIPYLYTKEGGRSYVITKKEQKDKKLNIWTKSECLNDPEVKKYFSTTTNKLKLSRVEGRLYWGTETKPKGLLFGPKRPNTIVKGEISPPTELEIALSNSGGIRDLDISTLVCGVGIDFDEILSSSPASQCSPYGRKIANSLIKVAATRIFANPSQAFMEPIANSIDAYFPKRRIGKFGMGFFSLLYWIMPNQAGDATNAKLEIENYSEGECYTAQIVFNSKDQSFRLSVKAHPGCMVKTRGVLIKLYPVRSDTEEDMVSRFRFIQGITLVDFHSFFIDPNRMIATKTLINPVMFRRYFSRRPIYIFEDHATGIPLSVLLSSLLVPSVSTKMIVGGGEKEDVYLPSRVVIYGPKKPSLVITVGDVIIWQSSPSKKNTLIILSLPGRTKLPVSRDDFVLDSDLSKLISKDVKNVLCPYFKNLSPLERLVKEYATFTSSDENAQVMESAMEEYRKSRGVLVPGQYVDSVYLLAFPNQEITGSEFYDTFSLEKWIRGTGKITDKNRWTGVEVIFYPGSRDSEVTFAGTNTFLFVPDHWLTLPDWPSRLEVSFQDRRLWVPKGRELSGFRTKIKGMMIEKASRENLELMIAVFGSIENKEPYFKISPSIYSDTIKYFESFYLRFPEYFYSIMTAWLTRLSKMQPEYEYGHSKPALDYGFLSETYVSRRDTLTPTQQKYFVQVFVWLCANVDVKDKTVVPLTLISFHLLLIDLVVVKSNLITYTEDFVDYFLCAKIIQEIYLMAKKFEKVVEINPLIVKGLVRDIKPIKRTLLIHYERLRDYWSNPLAMSPSEYLMSGIEDIGYLTKKYALMSEVKTSGPIVEIPVFDSLKYKTKNTFSVNDLIGTLFRIPYSGLDFYSKIGPGPHPKLQILSIAVNEATTKPYHEAVITELFQNSVDAIRAGSISPTEAEITFGVISTDTEVIFTITDPVGMTEDQFFHLGIPFLSTKIPSELQTGEMGTGFFNVYRQATKVEIETAKNGLVMVSIDVPMRGDDHRVVDITRTVYSKKVNKRNGTVIKLTIPVGSAEEGFEVSGKFITFINLVTSKAPLEIQIKLNDRNYPLFPGKLYVDNSYYQIFYQRLNRSPGLFCTKGIPVGFLSHYVSPFENLNEFMGVVVNIKHEGYTPTHSRSRINFSNRFVSAFVPMARFVSLMERQIDGTGKLNHAKSKSALSQVVPPQGYGWTEYNFNRPLPARALNFYNLWNSGSGETSGKEHSFAGLVTEIANVYGDFIPGTVIADDIITLNGPAGEIVSSVRWVGKNLFDLILINLADWFRPKNKAKDTFVPINLQTKTLNPKLIKWMTVYIEEYISFLQRHFDTPGMPKILIKVPDQMGKLGQYNPSQNEITIYVEKYLEKDGLVDLEKFIKAKDPNKISFGLKSELFKTYFFDADATLPHECEHFRRRNSHSEGGVHSPIEIDLFGLNKTYSFPEATMRIRSKMFEEGFWERVHERMTK